MPKGANNTYFGNIRESIGSLWVGMKLTMGHLLKANKRMPNIGIAHADYFKHTEGIFTNRYPHEPMPVPDNGRYQLHNEIDDCIVCDKCAKICPVDCIEIEPVRATGEIGKTSDGTTKRIHAAKFDIDMGKCCFCGLCTTVCPTECITMTKTYDFSSFDIKDHHFAYSEMTPLEILEARQKLDEANKAKEEAKQKTETASDDSGSKPAAKGDFRPKMRATGEKAREENMAEKPKSAKPVFKPKIKPAVKPAEEEKNKDKTEKGKKKDGKPMGEKPKPIYKPRPMTPKKKGGKDGPG